MPFLFHHCHHHCHSFLQYIQGSAKDYRGHHKACKVMDPCQLFYLSQSGSGPRTPCTKPCQNNRPKNTAYSKNKFLMLFYVPQGFSTKNDDPEHNLLPFPLFHTLITHSVRVRVRVTTETHDKTFSPVKQAHNPNKPLSNVMQSNRRDSGRALDKRKKAVCKFKLNTGGCCRYAVCRFVAVAPSHYDIHYLG